MKDWKVRLHCLIGSDNPINNALNQALRLEVAKAVAVPQARIKGYGPNGNITTSVQTPQDWTLHKLAVWGCQSSERTVNIDMTRLTRTGKTNKSWREEGVTDITIISHFLLM
jgi:hypothetical protein